MKDGFLAALDAARRAPLGQPAPPIATRLHPADLAAIEAATQPAPGFDPADLEAVEAVAQAPARLDGHAVDWFGLRTPLDLAPELASWPGGLLPHPPAFDPRALPSDWIALALSLAEAAESWRAISIATGRGDLLLAGAVASRRLGLSSRLVATEGDAQRRVVLHRHAVSNDLPEALLAVPPGRATLGDTDSGSLALPALLESEPRWDWLRIAQPGLVVPLLNGALDLLTARVRVLSLVTRHRGEEARAAATLAEAGWRLIGETPCRLSRADPRKADQPGVQAWRAPG